MILMIDNFDSFTYNLVQYLGEMGCELKVYRNNEITTDQIEEMAPEKIIISPGPCSPNEAGISVETVQRFAGKIPLLGVCLGHQAIGQAFGGNIIRAKSLMHGKTSPIFHDNRGVFEGLPLPFEATRYHSLVIQREKDFPDCLEISAETEDGEIMGVRHKEFALEGIQFHPESILTGEPGKELLRNFVEGKVSQR